MALTNATGTLPTRNWDGGRVEGFEEISAEAMKKKLVKRSKACFACAVACGKFLRLKQGHVPEQRWRVQNVRRSLP